MTLTCRHALKEWAVVIDVLAAGEQVVLFRKGGLAEPAGTFDIPAHEFFLMPGYEHQRADLLKPEFRERLGQYASPRESEVVELAYVADLVESVRVTRLSDLERLVDQHIWSPAFVEQRFNWREGEPLWVLVVRVLRLLQPHRVPLLPQYAGCTSWVELDVPLSIEGAEPVVGAIEFSEAARTIRERLAAVHR